MSGLYLRKSNAPKKSAPKKGAEATAKPKPQAADPNQQSYKGQAQAEGEGKGKGERLHLPTVKQVVAPEPVAVGDVAEFKHPKHGRVTRGRATAVGEHGATFRVADGSAVQVPHGHVTKSLPQFDFGADPDATPADAKSAFLAPTQPGGLPATPMQLALLDTLVQFGLPLDEQALSTMDYDTAKQLLAQAIGADESDLEPKNDDEEMEDPDLDLDGAGDDDQDGDGLSNEMDEKNDEAEDGDEPAAPAKVPAPPKKPLAKPAGIKKSFGDEPIGLDEMLAALEEGYSTREE